MAITRFHAGFGIVAIPDSPVDIKDSYGEWSQDVPTMLKSPRKPMVSGGCWIVDGIPTASRSNEGWTGILTRSGATGVVGYPAGLSFGQLQNCFESGFGLWTMIFWLQIAMFEVSFQYWDYWGEVIQRAPFCVCAWTCVYLQSPGLKLEAKKMVDQTTRWLLCPKSIVVLSPLMFRKQFWHFKDLGFP